MRGIKMVIVKNGRGATILHVTGTTVILSQYHVSIARVPAYARLPNRARVIVKFILMPRNKSPHVETVLAVEWANYHYVGGENAVMTTEIHFKAIRIIKKVGVGIVEGTKGWEIKRVGLLLGCNANVRLEIEETHTRARARTHTHTPAIIVIKGLRRAIVCNPKNL